MTPLNEWWPVAESAALRGVPMARVVCGVPLVLFRDASGTPAALLDRCPHRHVPLSAGKVCGGELVCCYHGWRFDRSGVCVGVPGVVQQPAQTQPIVRSFPVCEAHGLVWVFPGQEAASSVPVAGAGSDSAVDRFIITGEAHSTIDQAAENFLDASHTHFVHAGLVRREGARQRVSAKIRLIEGGVEVEYSNEAPQSGLISRLFESDRVSSFGRFRLPGVAEIEYRGSKGMTLIVTVWLTPASDHRLYVHAVVATPRGWLPAVIKRAVLRPMFTRIFRQDRAVLELQMKNRVLHGQADFLHSPLDLLGPLIRQLLSGERLDAGVERSQDLRL